MLWIRIEPGHNLTIGNNSTAARCFKHCYDFQRKYVCNQRTKLYHPLWRKFCKNYTNSCEKGYILIRHTYSGSGSKQANKFRLHNKGDIVLVMGGGGGVSANFNDGKKCGFLYLFFFHGHLWFHPRSVTHGMSNIFEQSCPHLSLTEIYPCSPDESVTYVECTVSDVPQHCMSIY